MDRANITDYSTRSGMKVSAAFLKLHRDILAGSTDEAISTAYDLYRTSAVMLEELWKQLELRWSIPSAWRSRALWPAYII